MSPRRTIADARQEFDVRLPGLSDYLANEGRKQLAAVEDKAKENAAQYIADREREVLAMTQEALRTLTECRDTHEELARIGQLAQLPADQFDSEWRDTTAKQQQAEVTLLRAEELVNTIATIEEDPITWYDGLSQRIPHMMEEFPW